MPLAKLNPATAAGEGSEKKGMPGAIFLAECCAGSDPPVLAQRLEAEPPAHLYPSSSKDHGKVALHQQSVRCKFEVRSRRRKGCRRGRKDAQIGSGCAWNSFCGWLFSPPPFPLFFSSVVCCTCRLASARSQRNEKRKSKTAGKQSEKS